MSSFGWPSRLRLLGLRLGFRRPDAAIFVAFLLPVALARLGLLVHKHIAPSSADLHGFVADLLVAGVLSLLFAPAFAKARWAIAVVLPWSVLNYMSYEFTNTMNAVPPWQSVAYLGDGTFVKGSVLVISSPILLALIVLVPPALLWYATRERDETRPSSAFSCALPFAPIVLLLAPVSALWPLDRDLFAWRQTNFIAGNVSDIVRPKVAQELPPMTEAQKAELERLFHADLDAPRRAPPIAGKPNVLFVLLEGISGTDLPSLAALHHHEAAAAMPQLDAIGKENVYFRNFITHQRGTNRGLYMSLCGDYDKLGTEMAKMSERAAGPDLPCLPAALRDQGYETVFLQAAPLAFMLKDTFMPKAGFTQTLGGEQFPKAYMRSNWGVDDRAFFERTREIVGELEKKNKPWMMTLLTVGTHHPYPVPDDFESPEPEHSFGRAARYADAAVSAMIRGLAEDGVLGHTIVLVSSDESHGDQEHGDDRSKLLTQNLSFMVAVLPTHEKAQIDDLFAQTDTALSVLDALGMAETPHPFIGRSFFRTYDEPRRVFIANQNGRWLGMVDSPQKNVWSCDEHFVGCDHIGLPGGSFVSESRAVEKAAPSDITFLRSAKARAAGAEFSPFRDLSLTSDREVPVLIEERDGQLLYAGQYLELPAGTIVDVDLELEAIGDGKLEWRNDFMGELCKKALYQPKKFTLSGGDVAVLRYTYRFDVPTHGIEARSVGRRIGETPVSLRFRRASMNIRAGAEGAPASLELRERSINGQPDPP